MPRAVDYAAFSKAAYDEYANRDMESRVVACQKTLKEWGVEPGWQVVGNPLFTNSHFTTFVNTSKMPHQVVISCRGTDVKNAMDMAADIDIARNKNVTNELMRRVQEVQVAAQILTGEQRFVHRVTGDDIGMPKGGFYKDDIIFTGHSLGGAVAAKAALDYDAKAVVYNMGSSPLQLTANGPKRDYDNVLHFTTNRVKDGVYDPVSVAQYMDKPGSGIHTVSYKLPKSMQSSNILKNHSIDAFKRTDDMRDEVSGYDAIYDRDVHALKHSYKYNDQARNAVDDGGSVSREYSEENIEESIRQGLEERKKTQQKAIAIADGLRKAAEKARQIAEAAKRAQEAEGSTWSWLHHLTSTMAAICSIAIPVAAMIPGVGPIIAGVLAGADALVNAANVVTTIGDDVVNWDHKSVGEKILDFVGIGASGLAAGVQGVVAGSKLVQGGTMIARGWNSASTTLKVGNTIVEDIQAGEKVGENVLSSANVAEEAVSGGANASNEIEMMNMVGEPKAPTQEGLLPIGDNLDVVNIEGDLDGIAGQQNRARSIFDEEDWLFDENAGDPVDIEMQPRRNAINEADNRISIDNDGPDDFDGSQLRRNRSDAEFAAKNKRLDAVNAKRQDVAQKAEAVSRGAAAAGLLIGGKRSREDEQDEEAEKRRKHNGSGTTPSLPPGSHMDRDEMMRFVDQSAYQTHSHGANTRDIPDVPTHDLQLMHKSLMYGRGIDITTQIPLVTAAKGNYLRHMAEVSQLY